MVFVGASAEGHSRLAGKEYKKAVEALARTSSVRVTDLDQKAIALLDALQERGRAVEACDYLKQMLQGIDREKVLSWRAYTYSLLRKFDESVYLALKNQQGQRSPKTNRSRNEGRTRLSRRITEEGLTLNPAAAEFVPGQTWPGVADLFGVASFSEAYVQEIKQVTSATVSTDTSEKEEAPEAKGIGGVEAAAAAATMAPAGGAGAGIVAAALSGPVPVGAQPLELVSALPQQQPELGTLELPSVGSAGHPLRQCKPCAFFGTKGCNSGAQCAFCHLCGPDEKKQRKKEKRLAAVMRAS